MIPLVIVLIVLIIIYLNILFKKENFKMFNTNTIDNVTREECYLIVNFILNYLNKKYNKRLIAGNIDRIEKTFKKDETNYKIKMFINNQDKFTYKKIIFDVSTKKNKIIVNAIKTGDSRGILEEERNPISGRGSLVYKPKINMDHVKPNNDSTTFPLSNNLKLKYTKETNKDENIFSIKDRHSWILDKDAIKHKNEEGYPQNLTSYIWDTNGVEFIYKTEGGIGLNNSYQKMNRIPNFIVSNFVLGDTDYEWLFDKAQDSASRPIGVGNRTP